jgi:ATP-dependent RNA helicase DBP3
VELKKGGIDCIVGTPGRLKDFINDGTCRLKSIKFLVLDEADRLLDMGFEEDVRYIVSQTEKKGRQTSMFTATWPSAIKKIAMEFMTNPIRLYVGFESVEEVAAAEDSLSANKRVEQKIEVIEDRQRGQRLRELLRKVHDGKNRVLVFALYKKEAEHLEYSLRKDGFNCCSIHGNKQQNARTEALAQFKDGSCPLMVRYRQHCYRHDLPMRRQKTNTHPFALLL